MPRRKKTNESDARAELHRMIDDGGAVGVIVFKDEPLRINVTMFSFRNNSNDNDAATVALSCAGLYSVGLTMEAQQLIQAVHPEIARQLIEPAPEQNFTKKSKLNASTPVKGSA